MPDKRDSYTVLPPSTGRHTPVMNPASSDTRYTAALATSSGCDSRPSGMVATKRARFSGVSGTPMKDSSMPVAPITGQMALTRMRSGASSTASDFEIRFAAAFEPLYQVRPGRGRSPA